MLRRLWILLCLVAIASAGRLPASGDPDTHSTRATMEATGRALGAALTLRAKLARDAAAAALPPVAARLADGVRPVTTPRPPSVPWSVGPAPSDARLPARAPPFPWLTALAAPSVADVDRGFRSPI